MKMIWSKIKEFFSVRQMNEEGAGSISLMVVSLAVVIMAGMVATTATMGMATTYDQLSQREANTSAENALNDAVGKLTADKCSSTIYQPNSNGWRWQIFKTANEKMPLSHEEENVFSGCPTKDDKWVLIVATGKGRDNALTSKTAVYKILGDVSSVIPQAITGKGVSTVSGTVSNPNEINKAYGLSGTNGSMYVGTDGLNCQNTNLNMNVVSLDGDPDQLVDCPIKGDFKTNGTTNFGTNSYLYGDLCSTVSVTAESSAMIKGTATVSTSCNSKIRGNFYGYLPDPRDAVKFTGAQCNNWNTFSAAVNGLTGDKNMVDLRGCTSADLNATINSSTANKKIVLQGNVTLLMNEGSGARNIIVSSLDGEPYTLSFATPSSVSSPSKSACKTAGSVNTYSNLTYQDGTSGILYSACGLTINNSSINGQIYSGEKLNFNNSDLNYSLVELPYAFRPVAPIGRAQQLVRVY